MHNGADTLRLIRVGVAGENQQMGICRGSGVGVCASYLPKQFLFFFFVVLKGLQQGVNRDT